MLLSLRTNQTRQGAEEEKAFVPLLLRPLTHKFTGKERGSESGIFNSGDCNPDQENCAGGSGFESSDGGNGYCTTEK